MSTEIEQMLDHVAADGELGTFLAVSRVTSRNASKRSESLFRLPGRCRGPHGPGVSRVAVLAILFG